MRDWNGGITEALNRKFRVARNGDMVVRPIAAANNSENNGARSDVAMARRGGGRGGGQVTTQPVVDARQFIHDEAVEDNRFNFEEENSYSILSDESLPDLTQYTQQYE